ncbi:MAG: acyl--CoA ligase [Candidatus Hydrogenedentes bacterium]|nr:acyl--CoA ligase [Candidatus Hydrogenedentota bacterium]
MTSRHTRDLAGPSLLLDHWKSWAGAVECMYTGKTWHAAELRERADEAARRFSTAGVKEGDLAVFMLTNTAAFPVVFMALLELGCNPVLVFAGSSSAEIERLAASFGIRWIVHDFNDAVSRLPQAQWPEKTTADVGYASVRLLETGFAPDQSVMQFPVAGVPLHPTSGTYGAARVCVRNQTAAVAEAENYLASIDIYRGVRIALNTPMSHAYAYGFGFVAALISDSVLVLDSAFNPKHVLNRESRRPSDILTLVPPMARALTRLARNVEKPGMAPHVFYAGAPCDPAQAAEFEQTFGARLYAIYGTTETGGIATSFSREPRRTGVGVPVANVSVHVCNTEQYPGLGEGIGEVRVASTSMMQGYVTDINDSVINDWATGDIGRIDANGNLHLTGRIKDVINVGGMKVDPAEIEQVLRGRPEVADVAVYPGLRDDGSEFVQAAIQPAGNVDVEVLRHACLGVLDGYKAPSRFHIVDAIPRTPSGKCLKIQCPGFPKTL